MTGLRRRIQKLTLRKITLFSLVSLFAIILGGFVLHDAFRPVVILETFSVPKPFEDSGYTPKVFTEGVEDAFGILENEAAKTAELPTDDTVLADDLRPSPIADITIVPPLGITKYKAVAIVQELFSREPVRVEGGVTTDSMTIQERRNFHAQFRMLKGSAKGPPILTDLGNSDPKVAMTLIAKRLFEEVNPYLAAVSFFNHKDYSSASRIIDRILGMRNSDSRARCLARNLWGTINVVQGDFQAAVAQYDLARREDPSYAPTYYNLGQVEFRKKDFARAIVLFRKAVDINSGYVAAHMGWANALSHLGRFTEATAQEAAAAKTDPKCAYCLVDWGWDAAAQGDSQKYAEAESKFSAAIALDPKQVPAYVDRGLLFAHTNRADKALEDFRKAAVISPERALIYRDWSSALSDLGRYTEALQKSREALANGGNELDFDNCGLALRALNRPSEAVEQFRNAIRFNPFFERAYQDLSDTLRGLGRALEADEVTKNWARAHAMARQP